jgi:hypothetical protein
MVTKVSEKHSTFTFWAETKFNNVQSLLPCTQEQQISPTALNSIKTFLVNDQRDAQIPFYVFIFIFNSLHVSSTLCSSSGETNCVNTTAGNSHSENM